MGHWVSLCVKCCRMVDSVPRWRLSLSWPIQSDNLFIAHRMIPPSGSEHSSTFLASRSWWGHIPVCVTHNGRLELVKIALQSFTNTWNEDSIDTIRKKNIHPILKYCVTFFNAKPDRSVHWQNCFDTIFCFVYPLISGITHHIQNLNSGPEEQCSWRNSFHSKAQKLR